MEWSEDGEVPELVEAEAVNKWLFNKDTVDKVLEHLMTRGQKVAGGDRLGKTIIFAKNQDHAEFIAERFNANYPHYKGEFAPVITFKTEYAQSLIDDFSQANKAPHIAISVDMLDTGIDVPEVVNLVFFKLVRSKSKFWQMVGRGTRLRLDLFGPGQPQVRATAALLEEKSNIPMVREQMPLIQDIQSDAWWDDVTTPMLESARKRLRLLVKLIEKAKRQPVYTDFEDQLGHEIPVALPGFGGGADFERFRAKARQFLRQHENHLTIHKLRWNMALTPADLGELERMLVEAGIGTSADFNRAKQESSGLGLFIRSLVGMDREAAKQAFGQFLAGKAQSANQIEFINLLIDYLTEHGVMDPGLLYESPFTDINPQGPEGVFTSEQVDDLIALLQEVRERAVA